MASTSDDNQKVELFALDAQQFDAIIAGWGFPKFRAQQVRDWVYSRFVTDPERMSNLSKLDREKLRELVDFGAGAIVAHQKSEDGTQKLLIEWPGGAQAETVMIPDEDRRTACVSSQVGCPVGCKFCASGLEGLKGNLTAGQIVEQVMKLNAVMSNENRVTTPDSLRDTHYSLRVNSIVFMGMGEPLSNYANVMQAIRVLHDPKGLNISARKITISTVGVPVRMKQLADEELPLNLAISLHAPTEGLRRELIPWAEHFSIDEILNAARYYFTKTGREITFEYILLSGVNDRPEHARQLVQLCKSIRANVNLLRYNEVETLPYLRPKSDSVMQFQEILRRGGVNAHVRKSRGRDIAAACGQLRRRENDQRDNAALVQLGT
ncbi:MAG: 23S rRNA (adenine(2503)-C(2))-methyltransferase RlmN [Burkholderiales bacterium]|nr:23S rRNA (adenine(2503)-C(2))-methyltransferase RlmN [Phycisphaerae bacterium]